MVLAGADEKRIFIGSSSGSQPFRTTFATAFGHVLACVLEHNAAGGKLSLADSLTAVQDLNEREMCHAASEN
eukprot:2975828-Amphidinium_carterae.1